MDRLELAIMRITLWQQFSSNHSADFQIVGSFETIEEATDAAEKLRHILRTISAYWQGLDKTEDTNMWVHIRFDGITPIEQALSEHYDIEWKRGVDWLPNNPEEAEKALILFERHVYLENIGNTYISAHPFDDLLRKWGAKVVGYYEIGISHIEAAITCSAPDLTIALKLETDCDDEFVAAITCNRVSITRDNLKLTYRITDSDLFVAVQVLLEYLKEHGCTQIEYEFVEVPA